jgi:hypothetical protein
VAFSFSLYSLEEMWVTSRFWAGNSLSFFPDRGEVVRKMSRVPLGDPAPFLESLTAQMEVPETVFSTGDALSFLHLPPWVRKGLNKRKALASSLGIWGLR